MNRFLSSESRAFIIPTTLLILFEVLNFLQNLLLTTLKLDVYQTFLTVGCNEKQTWGRILALYFHNVNGTCCRRKVTWVYSRSVSILVKWILFLLIDWRIKTKIMWWIAKAKINFQIIYTKKKGKFLLYTHTHQSAVSCLSGRPWPWLWSY